MKTKKIIEITADDILETFLDMTVSEYAESVISPRSGHVSWIVKETGHPDSGDYEIYLEKLIIEIDE